MFQKYFFSSTKKLKCCKIRFFDRNAKLKCWEENPQKLICESNNPKKMHFLCFSSLKLIKVQNVCSEARFLYLHERKGQTWLSNNLNEKSHERNCPEMKRSMVHTGRFYIKLFMSICTRKNSSIQPRSLFVFFYQIFTLFIARYYRHTRVQRTLSLTYCTHCL